MAKQKKAIFSRDRSRPIIELAKDAKGEWHWMLWSINGQPMATNVEPYKRRANATDAINAIVSMITDAEVIVATDP